MPAVKNVGEPCAGEPHARIDGGREETRDQSATPRKPGRLSPTRPLPRRLTDSRLDAGVVADRVRTGQSPSPGLLPTTLLLLPAFSRRR
jgi:hypothetical protein